ncbi:alpha/beta hydrolase [Microbacterium aurum]
MTDLLVLARNEPDALAPMTGNDPAVTAAWWDAMPEADRHRLIEAAPGVIGNLEGVLYADRDQANRIWLDEQLAQARNALDSAEQPPDFWQLLMNPRGTSDAQAFAIAEARERLEGLEGVQRSLRTVDGGEPRFLVSLTGNTPPLAAVAIGDVDTADVVSYTVPGMSATTTDMAGWAQSAQNLQFAQADADPGRTHAVIAWMGYETPPVPVTQGGFDVLDTKLAEAGAVKLNTALGGLGATRPDAVTNIVAHSYGTTTTAIALSTPGAHVDNFVSLGSAGLPSDIDEASDLRAETVYAGQARSVMAIDPEPGDQWAWSGRLGNHPVDPSGPTFGAVNFGTDSGVGGNPVTDHGTTTPTGNGYLDNETESLRNVANATTGHADRLTERLPSELTTLQRALIEGARGGFY